MFIISSVAIAQSQSNRLNGRIVDSETKEAIPFASVQLLALPDSTFISGTATQADGRFALSLPQHNTKTYLLQISFIGYAPINQAVKPSGKNLDLGEILLAPDGITLDETVITANAVMAITENDTTVYNSSAYRTPSGSMLEELVKQLPGSEITYDGRILIQGKEVKKILVDGKEYFADNPKTVLKNLPVEMVERIKAYERQSDLERLTGVDDGENEMVLDLSVKKNMKNNWVENFFGGIGNKSRYEVANTLNHFRDDLQFTAIGNLNNTNNQGFAEIQRESSNASGNTLNRQGITISRSLGMNLSKDWSRVKMRTNIQYGNTDNATANKTIVDNFLKQEKSITEGTNNGRNKAENLVANAYLEWKIDPVTNLVFRPTMRYSSSNRHSTGYQKSWTDDVAVNEKESDNRNDNSLFNTNFILQVNRKFSKKGRNIALRLDYGINNSSADRLNYSTTRYFKSGNERLINQKIDNTGDGANYRLQLVYAEPLPKAHFLQFRYSYQYRTATSDRRAYNWNEDTGGFEEDPDTLNSNLFKNQYSNHLFNIGLRSVKKKYNYTIGIDLEPQKSVSRTTVEGIEKHSMTKNVLNFSPTLNFKYKFSKRSNLQIIYRGKSRQPNIRDLQPIADMTNPLNIRIGNPELKPSYINSFNLNYNSYNIKHQRNIILQIVAENTINSVTNQVTYDSETGNRVTTPVNVNGNWRLQSSFSLNTPFRNRNWIFQTYTNLRYNKTNGFTTINKEDPQKSIVRHFMGRERLKLTYRSKYMEIAARADAIYNYSLNNVRDTHTRTCDLVTGTDLQGYLPWNLEAFSDFSYHLRTGYGYTGNAKNSLIWNLQLSRSFFKEKQLLLRFKVYDILRQETSVIRTITSTAMRDVDYNVLGSYFMFHVVVSLH
ncbi:TonB-dependent receptor [Bacteroides sp. 51]|uniref:TonB-dependent receptor n=1 Tax=Bacteroides sp. 51 TaxID=2302938 RepID=UPI0013D60F5F|nr:TonB-dependent receptor [Bacteroides sp. 51]NDV81749.1 TonB-dependent receptor [Bacteroides sp. 51]